MNLFRNLSIFIEFFGNSKSDALSAVPPGFGVRISPVMPCSTRVPAPPSHGPRTTPTNTLRSRLLIVKRLRKMFSTIVLPS